jgi:mannose-6-phosphate isomerase-like protein (cupin superfamily)
MNSKVNIAEKFSLFEELWTPKVVAKMNQIQFKLVKIQGEFTWHEHQDTDEVFVVIRVSDHSGVRSPHLSQI